jgi:magnesium-transporting ATPase (P-type)
MDLQLLWWGVLFDIQILIALLVSSNSSCTSHQKNQLFSRIFNGVRVMVFNATFNNISVITWWSVLFLGETGVPGENHRPDYIDGAELSLTNSWLPYHTIVDIICSKWTSHCISHLGLHLRFDIDLRNSFSQNKSMMILYTVKSALKDTYLKY